MSVGRSALVLSLAAVLFAAAALVVYGERAAPAPTFTADLREIMSRAGASGWNCEFQPLADTPEGRQIVQDTLQYNEAVLATYSNGPQRVSIYIAYWKPGRMSHRLIAGHTPDVCWVGSGWKCTAQATNRTLKLRGSVTMQSAEERTMELRGRKEIVLFWHVVGGKVLSYDDAFPPWHAFISDCWKKGLHQREEQFFIRISSPEPVAKWWDAEPVQAVIERLGVLGDKG
jgi:hypothetical protein